MSNFNSQKQIFQKWNDLYNEKYNYLKIKMLLQTIETA